MRLSTAQFRSVAFPCRWITVKYEIQYRTYPPLVLCGTCWLTRLARGKERRVHWFCSYSLQAHHASHHTAALRSMQTLARNLTAVRSRRFLQGLRPTIIDPSTLSVSDVVSTADTHSRPYYGFQWHFRVTGPPALRKKNWDRCFKPQLFWTPT